MSESPPHKKLILDYDDSLDSNNFSHQASPKIAAQHSCDEQLPHRERSIEESIRTIRQRLTEKDERVRQLRLVRTYRQRAETKDLDSVTATWKTACQAAIRDCYDKIKELAPTAEDKDQSLADMSLADFVKKLGIELDLVGFDEIKQEFRS